MCCSARTLLAPRLHSKQARDHMYLNSTLRQTLVIGGVSLLAVVGLIGWTRHGDEAPVAAKSAQGQYRPPQFGNPEPVSRDPNDPVVYAQSPFGTDAPVAPAYRAYGGPAPEAAPTYAMNSYAERTAVPARVLTQRRYYTTSHGRRRY